MMVDQRRWIRWLRYLACAIIVFGVVLVGAKWFVTTSDAYLFAQEFALNNIEVRERVGQVNTVEFRLFEGFNLTYGVSGGGEADLTFDVRGDKGIARMRLQMDRVSEVWRVREAKVTQL